MALNTESTMNALRNLRGRAGWDTAHSPAHQAGICRFIDQKPIAPISRLISNALHDESALAAAVRHG